MSYRDDLAAAQAKAAAAEEENAQLRRKLAAAVEEQPRPKLAAPENFHVVEQGGVLRVTWRWFKAMHLGMLLFAFVWCLFLVNWYTHVRSGDLTAMLFPLLHVTAGVVISYVAVTGLVNRTTVTVDYERLSIHHGPLPWFGSRGLPRAEIDQLFVEHGSSRWKKGAPTFTLCAVDRAGRKRTLISGLDSAATSRYLEVTLERHLGLPDEPVAGEGIG